MINKLYLNFLIAMPSMIYSQETVFELCYKIKINGISCGAMTFDLTQDPDGFFKARQRLKSNILFFHLDQSEVAVFEKQDAGLRPISYSFKRENGKKKQYTYVFDRSNYDLEQNDRLSLQFVLMDKLAHAGEVMVEQLRVVDDKHDYTIDPLIEYQETEIKVSFTIKDRHHIIFFDKNNHFLPTRFTQKRGLVVFEGTLEKSNIDFSKWWY